MCYSSYLLCQGFLRTLSLPSGSLDFWAFLNIEASRDCMDVYIDCRCMAFLLFISSLLPHKPYICGFVTQRKRRKKADDAAFCLAYWQLTKPFGKMALSAWVWLATSSDHTPSLACTVNYSTIFRNSLINRNRSYLVSKCPVQTKNSHL